MNKPDCFEPTFPQGVLSTSERPIVTTFATWVGAYILSASLRNKWNKREGPRKKERTKYRNTEGQGGGGTE